MTEAEVQAANEKQRTKRKVQKEFDQHLATVIHSSDAAKDWWKKWRTRVEQVVTPYYRSRKVLVEVEQLITWQGKKAHPRNLPGGPNELPLFQTRVDLDQWSKRMPAVGDTVLVRSGDLLPFWVGIIVSTPQMESQSTVAASSTSEASSSPSLSHQNHRLSQRNKRKADLEVSSAAAPSSSSAAASSSSSSSSFAIPLPKSNKSSKSTVAADAASSSRSTRNNIESAVIDLDSVYHVKWLYPVQKSGVDYQSKKQWSEFVEDKGDKAMWERAMLQRSKGEHNRFPLSAVNRMENIAWGKPKSIGNDSSWTGEPDPIRLGSMITSGTNVLNTDGRISKYYFKAIREDVCELRDVDPESIEQSAN
jgi:hypothetical protein